MKLAFIGAHKTGKTELAERIYTYFAEIPHPTCFVKNIAGEIEKTDGINLLKQSTRQLQERILETQIIQEIQFAASLDYWDIISDGAPLSHYAYFREIERKRENKDKNSEKYWGSLDNIVKAWMYSYNKIFKLDPRQGADDGIIKIDMEINNLLKRFDIRHVRLYDKDRPNWENIVKKELGYFL